MHVMNPEDFLPALFRDTVHKVELRALGNRAGAGIPPRKLVTRNPQDIQVFIDNHDKAASKIGGKGIYFGVATRRIGSGAGSRADLVELPAVWIDIDAEKIGLEVPEAVDALDGSPIPPTFQIHSGHGLHAYWQFTEPINVEEIGGHAETQILRVLKRLAETFAGDPNVCDLPRILRMPGTHNSKSSPARLCHVLNHSDRQYELDDLDDQLETMRPLLMAPGSPEKRSGEDHKGYEGYMKAHGIQPRLDPEKALQEMEYQAPGNQSVHQTQLRVTASLVNAGWKADKICAEVLKVTKEAAPRIDPKTGSPWDWVAEEKTIRRMIRDAEKKFKPENKSADSTDAAPAKIELPAKVNGEPAPGSLIAKLGSAIIQVWTDERGELLATGGDFYAYDARAGYWSIFDRTLDQALDVELQKVFAAFQVEPRSGPLGDVKRYIKSQPDIYQPDTDFNTSGLIVCRNCCVDPRDGKTLEHSAQHYQLFGIDVEYQPAATCPVWEEYLQTAFSDIPTEQSLRVIATVQEWFGSALVRGKSRELMKGLIAYGASRTGKTVMAGVARALIGGRSCALAGKELGEHFGRQALIGSSSWIADDAIKAGDTLDAESWKIIVSGEPISIPRKNQIAWEGELDIPVMLTANALPRITDQTDAVYNRTIFLPMNVVHSEADVAGRVIIDEIRQELAGVLNWSIEGWRRLEARGRFDPPSKLQEAMQDYRDEQDPCGAWMSECVERDDERMVHRSDLTSSMNGYQFEADGRSKNELFGSKRILSSIRRRYPHVIEHRNGDGRMFVGIRLNDNGIEYWRNYADQLPMGAKAGSGVTEQGLNRKAPERSVSLERKKRATVF